MSGAKSSSATGTTGIADPELQAASPATAAGEAAHRPVHGRAYRGRFAPTPSGPLHFGSLVAAVGGYLDARAHGGEWLVRIEDLDPPRERPGAADLILRTLDAHGLHWDGEVMRQSRRSDAYAAALSRLQVLGLVRECSCSRSALAALPENRGPASGDELFHPADCIGSAAESPAGHSVRFRCPDREVCFEDRAQGAQSINVARTVGDFVLQRRDGPFAYQLAVVVDDAEQGVTDIVRGADLLMSTPRQILLQQALDLPSPIYLHLPLAVDERGLKLSKSENAPPAGWETPAARVVTALEFLQQTPPPGLREARLDEVWRWATGNWQPQRLRGVKSRTIATAARHGEVQENTR